MFAGKIARETARPEGRGVAASLPARSRANFGRRSLAGAPLSLLRTLQSAGIPLDPSVRTPMEGRFRRDFSQVRVHRDAEAQASARDLNARAYTVGNDVVFGAGHYAPATATGRGLIAHELAHTLQQDGSRPSPGLFAAPAQEAAADRAAAAALAGRPPGGQAVTGPTIARQSINDHRDAGVTPAHATPSFQSPAQAADAVRAALRRRMEVAGVGDYHAAFGILNGLSMRDLLATLARLHATGDIGLLVANFGAATPFNEGRLQVAMTAVIVAQGGTGPFPGNPAALPAAIRALPADQANELMIHLAHVGGGRTPAEVRALAAEGQQALAGAQNNAVTYPPAATTGATPATAGAMYGPGMWAPGGMWPSFYIGNAAHMGIAAYYRFVHLGQVVFTNFTSVASILAQVAGTALAPGVRTGPRPSAADLAGKPDIANLSLHHLYEIKPEGSEGQALTEVRWYQATFGASGIPMMLGPTTDAGVNGFFYDIGHYIVFRSPQPGVVTYRLRRQAPSPVPVAVPQGSRVRTEEPGLRFGMPRLTPQQAAATGAAVGIGAILLFLLRFAPLLAL